MRCLVLLWLVAMGMSSFGKVGESSRREDGGGAEAKYVYHVVDDEGRPVSDVKAHVSFTWYGTGGKSAEWTVHSDSNGVFVVSHRVNGSFNVVLSKEGYYRSFESMAYFSMRPPLPIKDGKWQPYGEIRQITLNRIRRPARMQYFKRNYYGCPAMDRWLGFDLERADWTGVYGTGVHEDVLIRFSEENPSTGRLRKMEVSFTNNVHGGVYVACLNRRSEMASPYAADVDGGFEKMVAYTSDLDGSPVNRRVLGDGECLVFRTRTRVRTNGELVAAHYGKIYGPWEFIERGGMSIGRIVFNPVENNPNLEDLQTVLFSKAMER